MHSTVFADNLCRRIVVVFRVWLDLARMLFLLLLHTGTLPSSQAVCYYSNVTQVLLCY